MALNKHDWVLECPDSLRPGAGLECPNLLSWGAEVSEFTEMGGPECPDSLRSHPLEPAKRKTCLCNGRSPQQTLTIRIISTTRAFPWKNGVTFSPRFPRTFVLSG